MLGGWHLREEKPGGVYEAEQFVLVQNRPGTSSREPGLAQVGGREYLLSYSMGCTLY